MAIAQRQYQDTMTRPALRSRRNADVYGPPTVRPVSQIRARTMSAQGQRRSAETVAAARPWQTRAGQATRPIAWMPLLRPILAAAGLTATLVVYVSGYAQMTRAGYERVWLQSQQRSLRVEQQLLRSDLLLHHNKEAVQRWAAGHGFARASETPLVVQRTVAERR